MGQQVSKQEKTAIHLCVKCRDRIVLLKSAGCCEPNCNKQTRSRTFVICPDCALKRDRCESCANPLFLDRVTAGREPSFIVPNDVA